jgi:AAA-ATPase Vps4-associated protein 1
VVSPEEIARIKAEWEAKEARKKDKAKAAVEKGSSSTAAGTAVGEGKKEEEGKDNGAKAPLPSFPGALSSPSVTSSATPTHKRYSLHRDFYAMRQAEHRRRRKATQTQELVPRLPGAPRGSLQ